MSTQKFSAAEREAIWIAYGRKCTYTGQLLDVSNFHIDHIIPESKARDTAVLNSMIIELRLPVDFDIFGYENLLPCHPRVNLEKRDLILNQIHYFLGIAASKKDNIEANLTRIMKRESRGKAAILLMRCLERGDLPPYQIPEILQQYPEQSEPIFELIEGMPFANATEMKPIAKADIEALWDLPICLGEYYAEGLLFTNEKNEQFYVRTCKEYEFAIEHGYLACSNAVFKISVRFHHQHGLLKSLQSAITPQRSFISNPKVGVVDLKLLPFSLFPWIDNKKSKNMELDPTYQDKLNEGVLTVTSVGQNSLEIIAPGEMGQQLVEVVRADFNGDGIEDLLLFQYSFDTPGSLGYGGIYILTRKSVDAKFELVESM